MLRRIKITDDMIRDRLILEIDAIIDDICTSDIRYIDDASIRRRNRIACHQLKKWKRKLNLPTWPAYINEIREEMKECGFVLP